MQAVPPEERDPAELVVALTPSSRQQVAAFPGQLQPRQLDISLDLESDDDGDEAGPAGGHGQERDVYHSAQDSGQRHSTMSPIRVLPGEIQSAPSQASSNGDMREMALYMEPDVHDSLLNLRPR